MTDDEARALRRRSHAEAVAALQYARRHRAQGRPDLVALAFEDLQRCRSELRLANILIASSDGLLIPHQATGHGHIRM